MVFDPDKRQHKIETAGFRIDGDYSHSIPVTPEYYSDTKFNDAFYQERRDQCNRLVGLPVQPIIYPGDNTIPQPPPGSVAVAIHYEGYNGGEPTIGGVSSFYWLDTDGTVTQDVTKTGTVVLPTAELQAHDGFAYWAEVPGDFTFFPQSSNNFKASDVEFLSWTNTTELVNSATFGMRMQVAVKLHELQYLDTQNWNSLRSVFNSTSPKFIDWSGALVWDTSNVTDVSYFLQNGGTSDQIADLSVLDWTAVTDANNFLSTPYDGVPRWIEKIEWGPGLNNLAGVGSDAPFNPGDDLCKDGEGNLDLRGWCVSNIATKPSKFFNSSTAGASSTFNTIYYPLWGECPAPIDQFAFPTDKVIVDLRVIDELDAGDESSNRNIHISGTEAIHPVRNLGGVLKVMPSIAVPADKFVIPTEDIAVGYIFIGDPTTFAFGNNTGSNSSTYCHVGIGFGEYTNTSLWENNQPVFAPFNRVLSGLNYIDTSLFTSLKNAFNRVRMVEDLGGYEYKTSFPWHEMANWDTSNVTNFEYCWHNITPDAAQLNWDLTSGQSFYQFMTSAYGFPAWIEGLRFGPNATDMRSLGNRFESEIPIKGDYVNNYYVGQKIPLDLSGWNVPSIPSKPSAFMTPYPFDSNMISSWIIQPNWGQ